MALSDWPFGAHGPEVLVDVGTVGLQRQIDWAQVVAEFGDGYYGSALIGSVDGVRSWKCTWVTKKDIYGNPGLVIPIWDDGTIVEGPSAGVALSFSVDPITHAIATNATYGDMQPRMTYLARFSQRRIQDGLPFVFADPGEYGSYLNASDPYDYSHATKWLARFKTASVAFKQTGQNNMWSYSTDIVAVRPGYY